MAKGQRFQRLPSSKEVSIWDAYQGEFPALTSWAAPTYEHWYPYPFGDPSGGRSPLEKLTDPGAPTPAPAATPPNVPNLAPAPAGSFSVGEAPMFQPGNAGAGALGLLAGAGAGMGVEAGVDKLGIAGASPTVTSGVTTGSSPVGPGAAGEATKLFPAVLGSEFGASAAGEGGSAPLNLGVDKTIFGPSTVGQLPPLEQPPLNLGIEPSIIPASLPGGQGPLFAPEAPGFAGGGSAITGTTPPLAEGTPNAAAFARETAAGGNESLMGANPFSSLTASLPFAQVDAESLAAAGLPASASLSEFLAAASPELIEASGMGGLYGATGAQGAGTAAGSVAPFALPLAALALMLNSMGEGEGSLVDMIPFGSSIFGSHGTEGLFGFGGKSDAERKAKEATLQQHLARGAISHMQNVVAGGFQIPDIVNYMNSSDNLSNQGFAGSVSEPFRQQVWDKMVKTLMDADPVKYGRFLASKFDPAILKGYEDRVGSFEGPPQDIQTGGDGGTGGYMAPGVPYDWVDGEWRRRDRVYNPYQAEFDPGHPGF